MIILGIIVGGAIIFAADCLVGRFIRAGGAWDECKENGRENGPSGTLVMQALNRQKRTSESML